MIGIAIPNKVFGWRFSTGEFVLGIAVDIFSHTPGHVR